MHPAPYALALFLAAMAMVLLASYGWRHRAAHPAAPAFVCMVICVALWLAGYGIEIMGATVAGKETWETGIIVSLAWLPFFWLVFAIRYSGQDQWLTTRSLVLLVVPSIATTILTLTNPVHHLVWTAITLDDTGPFLATVPLRGPWFWVHSAFTYSFILFGIGLLLIYYSRAAAIFRRQGLIVFASSLIPLVGNALHLAGLIPVPGLDPGAFAFALSAGLLSLGLFRYHLLDIVPVAQRVVLDHLHDGVIVLDPHDRIVDLNPAARSMLGLGDGELVGQLAAGVLRSPEMLRKALSTDAGSVELPIATSEAQRWMQVSTLPLRIRQQRAAGRILVFHDITEERAAELLRQDLTRITIHDLRNPLNVVSASLDVLFDARPGAIDGELHTFLHLARRGCQRALDLVTSMLQLSQLESGTMPLNRQAVRPAELIAEVAQGMQLLAREGELSVSVEVHGELPPIWADPALLRRILENLAGNAVKFTPPGGSVRIAPCLQDGCLLIVISDTGPGIPPQMEGRLFQKFATGSVDKQGTGLGLAFCKLAVEAHGGRIWIESKPGQGTSVYVSMPVSR